MKEAPVRRSARRYSDAPVNYRGTAQVFLCTAGTFLCANCYLLYLKQPWLILPALILFVAVNLFPGLVQRSIPGIRLKVCQHGILCMWSFLWSTLLSLVLHGVLAFLLLPERWTDLLWSLLVALVAETVLFWNGVISVYVTSVQLGIKVRILCALLGLVPGPNLLALFWILRVVREEVRFETEKCRLDARRAGEQICATKYPIMLVHGVFFRDFRLVNYWGRIPGALKKNGAQVYYGKHPSAASVADSAELLKLRVREILIQTKSEKINLIAHSKGGLDLRKALTDPDFVPLVASVTTINTPHRGCSFADYLLKTLDEKTQRRIARAYNDAARRLGDINPDFMAAVRDLTADACEKFDRETPAPEGVFCQSVGSTIRRASGGKFPMNFTYAMAKRFDGPNDGLVSVDSFPWGSRYQLLSAPGRRGISHSDIIDLNRENIPGFDVREFYVQLVHDLKEQGF